MNIGVTSDHRGYKMKQKLTKYLTKKKYNVFDYGASSVESVDYPEYAINLGHRIISGQIELGIAICGTGIGVSIACNKVKGVSCAKVDNVKEAKLARRHNNANAIAISSSKPFYEIKDIVDAFLKTKFLKEERHVRRISQIKDYEMQSDQS